jgi:hypothetical protein
MMAFIQTAEKGGNKGSCSDYVSYLEKENEHKNDNEKEYFFSNEKDKVFPFQVVAAIDGNNKRYGKKDDKFFSVTLAPSPEELKHIGSDKEKLKQFTRVAMEQYANNFQKKAKGDDLLYFAKIETQRAWKGTDSEVRLNQVKSGALKEGRNEHIHVIVSRRAKENGRALSPNDTAKGTNKAKLNGVSISRGFDQQKFSQRAEIAFDKPFDFKREREETLGFKLDQEDKRESILNEYSKEQEVRIEQEQEQKEGKARDKGRGM